MLLGVSVAGLSLKHPVMNASGILGSSPEHIDILVSYNVSAVVTKTITLQPREGYETPIIIELPNGGVLNAVGLANPGVGAVKSLVSRAKALKVPLIASIGGRNEDEFIKVAIAVDEAGVDAIELNLSCPHTKGYGIEIGVDPHNVYSVTKNVASITTKPILAKLGLSDSIVKSCEKALSAGAKALTLINTVKAMFIDVYTAKPVLSNVFGGLSGPPIHPIVVRVVYEVYRELKPEIVGCGGVSTWSDAAELILAGARAIQVGTALMKGGEVVARILKGLEEWLKIMNLKGVEEAVGLAQV
ncbi:MAG: dihydroorotate dehydrogenase PyrD [Desulfurococcaceae archaeon]